MADTQLSTLLADIETARQLQGHRWQFGSACGVAANFYYNRGDPNSGDRQREWAERLLAMGEPLRASGWLPACNGTEDLSAPDRWALRLAWATAQPDITVDVILDLIGKAQEAGVFPFPLARAVERLSELLARLALPPTIAANRTEDKPVTAAESPRLQEIKLLATTPLPDPGLDQQPATATAVAERYIPAERRAAFLRKLYRHRRNHPECAIGTESTRQNLSGFMFFPSHVQHLIREYQLSDGCQTEKNLAEFVQQNSTSAV